MKIEGRNVLITGASRGIGRAIALLLSQEGANVAINYKEKDDAAFEVKREIEALGKKALLIKGDVSKSFEVKKIFTELNEKWEGRIDVLVNNAGIVRDALIYKMTDQQWEEVIRVNLNSLFYCTREAFPMMIKRQYGKIINISSTAALMGNIGQANYSSSKAGVIGFTKAAALEGAKFGIRVNAVCPGLHKTDMLAHIPADILAGITAKIPLGYVGIGLDVARAVSFLASSASDYITGQTIVVNGGLYMN